MKQELVPYTESAPTFELLETKRVSIAGVEFEESFIAGLVGDYFSRQFLGMRPKLSTALQIYIKEKDGYRRHKFLVDTTRCFMNFTEQFGDVYLDEIKHYHAVQYRDLRLGQGLSPSTIRKHIACFNAMLNVAFRYFSVDRLSPFRALQIPNEGKFRRPMPQTTVELTNIVKQRLIALRRPNAYIGLILLNTGCRISEPVFAKREDVVLDHEIPHLWIRPNELSERKNQSSIRAVPLLGESLRAARILFMHSKDMRSPWLVPQYARPNGNTSCSAILNKNLRDLGWRSHMFRHALIDRLKACGDIPVRLAESITGHSSGGSEFDHYGTIGYTLQQKLNVLQRVVL